MALAVTQINFSVSNTGGNRTLAVPAGGVPLGALIVVPAVDTSNAPPNTGSVADAGGNAYTFQAGVSRNNVQANGFCAVFTAPVTTALTSTQLITYTKAVSGSTARVAALYVTGQDATTPVDTTATATGFGSGTAISVTSGTPANSGPLCIGMMGAISGGTVTPDAAWASQYNSTATLSEDVASLQVSGTATSTYAPTQSTSRTWGAIILVVNPPISGGSNPTFSISGSGDQALISASTIGLTGAGVANLIMAPLFGASGVGGYTPVAASKLSAVGAGAYSPVMASSFSASGAGVFMPLPAGSASFGFAGVGSTSFRSAAVLRAPGVGAFNPVPFIAGASFTMNGLCTVSFAGSSFYWTPDVAASPGWAPGASGSDLWTKHPSGSSAWDRTR
jgi:hypothetical protein